MIIDYCCNNIVMIIPLIIIFSFVVRALLRCGQETDFFAKVILFS